MDALEWIIGSFVAMVVLVCLAAYFMARWLYKKG